MAYKPGDFFLGVIDFLAILVPGAILLLLKGTWFCELYPMEGSFGIPGSWFSFLVVAYVLGHFLFAAGEWAVDPIYYLRHKKLDFPESDYYKKLSKQETDLYIKLKNKPIAKARKLLYHRAFSRVRLKGGDVLAEVERSAAIFKLFRSLVLVFALDAVLSFISIEGIDSCFFSLDRIRVIVSVVFTFSAYYRFESLKKWTEGLVFEFAVLISSARGDDDAD